MLAYGAVADDFPYLAKTPAKAAKQALEKIGKSPEDVDLWEINEAFASVAINSLRMLGVDEDNVNVNGGAIALGHPIGASGARIVGALVHELRRRGGGLGCAAICSGGGQGDAIVLEVNGGLARARRTVAGRRLLRPRQDPDGGVERDGVRPGGGPAGLVSRGQLARWGGDHLRYRLRGATDERDGRGAQGRKEIFTGVPERDIDRMGPEVLAGILPRIYPQMLEEVHAPPGRGPGHLHRQRRRQRDGGELARGARHGGRHRHAL